MNLSAEAYFDNLEDIIKGELSKAKEEIKIAVAWLNTDIYYNVIAGLLKENVKVELILNDSPSNYSLRIYELRELGLKRRYITMPGEKSLMHHKFCIIDNSVVITGSYNWSFYARANFENIVVVRNEEKFVAKFLEEFELLKRISTERIQQLQNLQPCAHSNCTGATMNILVYGRNLEKYGEAIGDVVQICSEHPDKHYKIIERNVINYELERVADDVFARIDSNWPNYADVGRSELTELDYQIAKAYTEFSNKLRHLSGIKSFVHAWGRVRTIVEGKEMKQSYITKIYWKDKFVRLVIANDYNTIFPD